MKHNHDHHPEHVRNADPRLVPVRFEFNHSTATTVRIAGTFNDWHPEAKAMHDLGNGRWLKETVLLPGKYEYLLVVDGHWMPDPLAKETVPNPFGGRNSVLKVATLPVASDPAGTNTLPLKKSNK